MTYICTDIHASSDIYTDAHASLTYVGEFFGEEKLKKLHVDLLSSSLDLM